MVVRGDTLLPANCASSELLTARVVAFESIASVFHYRNSRPVKRRYDKLDTTAPVE